MLRRTRRRWRTPDEKERKTMNTQKKKHPLWLFAAYLSRGGWHLAMYLVLAPLNALVEIGLAAAMAAAVDYAMSGQLQDMGRYVGVYALYVLLGFAVGYGVKRARILLLGRVISALKQDVYDRVMHLPYPKFRESNSAEYLAQLTSNMEIVRESYFTALLRLYPEVLQFVVATVAMLWLSPWLGLYVLLLAALQLVVPAVFSKKITEKGRRYARCNEDYMVAAKEDLLSYETSTLYQILDILSLRHRSKNAQAEEARSDSKRMNALSYEVSFAIGNVMYLGIYVIGAFLTLTGHLGVPAIIAAAQLMVYIASPLTTISGDVAELKSALKVVGQYGLLLTEWEHTGAGVQPGPFAHSLALDHVTFSYGARTLLEDQSYAFEKGKKYIIHGESGCGKSTLLKLIQRLLPPQAGAVTLDGVEVDAINRKAYAAKLCCIPQEPFLFDETVLENVRLYRDYTPDQVLQALDQAGLSKTVANLPQGVHTPIGENASFLSGGEKQRLAIARALLSHPEILLVDEGTSHLDPDTAREIERLIFSIPDLTVIAVSHILHPSTVRMAHKMLRLSGGILEEEPIV